MISSLKPDLTHFLHLNVPLFYNGKFVVTIHDLTMQKQGVSATTLSLPFYYVKRFPFKVVAEHAAKKSVKIISPTNATKEELVKYYSINPDKVAVSYLGVDQTFTKKLGDRGEFEILSAYNLIDKDYIFYIGNAYPHKNLSMAIGAIGQYNKTHSRKLYFAIGGLKDKFIEKLMRISNEYGVGDYVKYLGYVQDEELPVIYKASLAFVYPSLSEGFGLQGLEAILSKTILLASDIPVFREVYGDNALFFDPHDAESLVNQIDFVLKLTPGERESRIQKAREFAKKYSWTNTARETLNIYNSFGKTLSNAGV